MTKEELKNIIQFIVSQTKELKDKYLIGDNSKVNYVAVFSQNDKEYKDLLEAIKEIGGVAVDTSSLEGFKPETGPLFKITPLDTVAGSLKLVKIRKPDETRPERGDADFTVANYDEFKKDFSVKRGFNLIKRGDFEMIEIIDSEFNVRVYFSSLPLEKQLINKKI